ncbi:T5orf172 domain-containing protein [Amphritea atlantica]|uniref:T5orf172 domain-containing protein n=1 Tax=Amphritea atlantica TaxID=355243 RepID=A0A1H9HD73_9GAMM|nr:GIY-YIG nuclease family protein [Amphritea atlantica]SEQ60289.1 T5orf172 domain-containing protein [Amphritea atlantica]
MLDSGYVYILINESMPGLIKIGRTKRDSRSRARELFKTGVPTPFQVAFEVFCDDYEGVEKKIHDEISDFRVNSSREFFKYPIDKAIRLLQKSGNASEEDRFSAIEILERLQSKYTKWLKTDIVSVRIVQPKERVWLEITQEKQIAGYLVDQTIKRTDLGFIAEDYDDKYFSPADDISINAEKFVDEFGPYSIMMTTDLFHEEGCSEVNERFNTHRA